MIETILRWAKKETPIRAIILVGSRARQKQPDPLSDYDLSIFTTDASPYTYHEQWLSKLGKPWVCIHEKVYCFKKQFPTRLVIFEGGIKIDFAFFSLDILKKLTHSPLPVEYDSGYQILLDKDQAATDLPLPSFKSSYIAKPKEHEFLTLIKEFWFEVYHVAVYLKRKDLWSAKFRETGLHQLLLKMIEWNELSKHQWRKAIPPMGKHMKSWVSKNTWEKLIQTFSACTQRSGWIALLNTVELFRLLAAETAQELGFTYPEELDQSISEFVINLHQ